jgi:Ca2+-binding RTX toxin-like protein
MLALFSALRLRAGTRCSPVGRGRTRLVVEVLEDRTLLSTIVWANRGSAASDSDDFGGVFGSQAAAARAVVDAAISAWQNVILNFNFSDHSNTFTLNIYTSDAVRGVGGQSYFASRYDATGKPMQGDILIESGNDGRGAGWWLDPTPTDSGEFLGNIINPYAGNATPGGPAAGKADLFTLAVHEISHAIGLTADPASAFQKDANHYLTATGRKDQAFNAGKLFLFRGPDVQALLTSYNRVSPGSDSGVPTHTAEPINTFTDANGVRYSGSEDANNAYYEFGRRYLPSYLDALILHDAYGYTLAPADAFHSFHAVLNQTAGELRIRGGYLGTSDDTITIGREGNQVIVAVNIGNTVPGTGPARTLTSRYNAADVQSIVVRPGNGNDVVRLRGAGLGIPVNIDMGDGNDTLVAPDTANAWRIADRNSGTLNGNVRFLNTENLQGGKGADVFTFADGKGVTGRIDGGGGVNTLDYSAYRQQVVVSLAGCIATGVGQGIRGIANVFGGYGNDLLFGDAGNNILRGGPGNDTLYGYGGEDILIGDQGADSLVGGAGRDLLVGGTGADILKGEDGDDILVAGPLRYDADVTKLAAILAEWRRTDLTFQQRMDHLRNGGGLNVVGGVAVLLNPTNALDDDGVDTLTGGGGQDWFWGTVAGSLADVFTDLSPSKRLR